MTPNPRTMNNTINYDDEQKQELIERISDVLNETGAYNELHKLLVDREEVILHSDMENLACELEDFIFNWTQIEE
jgi:mannitol/fructose-specific phosphotransferase system IIA component (Ntr-type)